MTIRSTPGIAIGIGTAPWLYIKDRINDIVRTRSRRGADEYAETGDPTGEPTQSFKGTRPKNEDDVLQVCRNLTPWLRRSGMDIEGAFAIPAGLELGVDAFAKTKAGGLVQIQVTRVLPESTFLAHAKRGSASESFTIPEKVAHLQAAVNRKREKTPPSFDVILALDAFRSPGHAIPEVVKALLSGEAGEFIALQQYAAVLFVGPTSGTTYLLAERGSD